MFKNPEYDQLLKEADDRFVVAAWEKESLRLASDGIACDETNLLDIKEMDLPPIEWAISTLLTRDDGPVLLFGGPGSMKSWLAQHLVWCFGSGEAFLGRYSVDLRYRKAVFVNFDAPRMSVLRRFKALGIGKPCPGGIVLAHPEDFSRKWFESFMARYQESFVVLDCFADIYRPDPNVEINQALREFCKWLRGVYEANGCNGIVIDHSNRQGTYYGGVQLKATFRVMWEARYEPKASVAGVRTDPSRITLFCEKPGEANRFDPLGIDVSWAGVGCEPKLTWAGQTEVPDTDQVLELLEDNPDQEFAPSTIASRWNWDQKRAWAACKSLFEAGKILRLGGGVYAKFSVSLTPED